MPQDRTKKTRPQLDLGLTGAKRTPRGPESTLEVSCSNCGAKFVAYYGSDEENLETVEVVSCGLCHGEEYRRDNPAAGVGYRTEIDDLLSRPVAILSISALSGASITSNSGLYS